MDPLDGHTRNDSSRYFPQSLDESLNIKPNNDSTIICHEILQTTIDTWRKILNSNWRASTK